MNKEMCEHVWINESLGEFNGGSVSFDLSCEKCEAIGIETYFNPVIDIQAP